MLYEKCVARVRNFKRNQNSIFLYMRVIGFTQNKKITNSTLKKVRISNSHL